MSARRRDTDTASPVRADPAIAAVAITHGERLVFDDPRISKLELARYYEEIGEQLLAHLRHRPLSLVRCPHGTTQPCFFQRHMAEALPAAVQRIEDAGPARLSLVVASLEGILGLVQHNVIEFHTWGSRLPRQGAADRLTLDLDPDPSVPWKTLVAAALRLRALVAAMGLVTFLKTTGGKGLHLVAPLSTRAPFAQAKEVSRAIACQLSRAEPTCFTASSTRAHRAGRIYIDYLRNGAGATAVAAWSVRARPGAPVSVPLAWDELSAREDLRERHFNIGNVRERLRTLGADPWADYTATRQGLTKALRAKLSG
jgi:bifunctional non-homologous end joining protein LigD